MSDDIKPQDTHLSDAEDGEIKPSHASVASEDEKATAKKADPQVSGGGDDGDIKPLDSHIG